MLVISGKLGEILKDGFHVSGCTLCITRAAGGLCLLTVLLQIYKQHIFLWHISLINAIYLRDPAEHPQPALGVLLPSAGSASCQPACTVPSSRNSSSIHLRINPIINTFVGGRLKVML